MDPLFGIVQAVAKTFRVVPQSGCRCRHRTRQHDGYIRFAILKTRTLKEGKMEVVAVCTKHV
jgi:hypothetical protein